MGQFSPISATGSHINHRYAAVDKLIDFFMWWETQVGCSATIIVNHQKATSSIGNR